MIAINNLDPIELRHLLHQNPELMFNEYKTTDLLFENLNSIREIVIYKPLQTGLVLEYTVNDGLYLLFRADIDALPIEEKTNCNFSSKNKNMHACGHDVHSAILYGLIKEIVGKNIDQNCIFVFQPAEEGGGGAEQIMASGILEKYNIKNAFALHVTDEYDFGTIASTEGILFASSVEIDLNIFGKAAHVAFPENGIDSLLILRTILDEIDSIISKEPNPTLFACGKITGGNVRNILAESARAECTLRTLSIEQSKKIINKIGLVASKIEDKTHSKIDIHLNAFYTEVVVDKKLYKLVKRDLEKDFNFIDCGLKMTAEDFGFFSKKYPSFMFWLGTSKGEKHGLHTPYFLPDDEIIRKGIDVYLSILENYKKENI
jgi:N-acetyldiaminopimelate deacetylase